MIADMQHFVQYHNTERMGGPYKHVPGDPYRIVTNKSIAGLKGNTVWLIAGEGRPRSYTLCCRFIADDVGDADNPHFRHYASGFEGATFAPPIPLNGLRWFEKLYNQTQNFSLGLMPVSDEIVEGLENAK
jgi:hypothetical protein